MFLSLGAPPPTTLYKQSLAAPQHSQKDPDDSRTTSREQEPHTHSTLACVIDPSNGDNGCYSHTWEDQTVRKEPSAPAVHAPDWAASIHYAFLLAGERLDQSTFFRKVKGGEKKKKRHNIQRTLTGNMQDWKAPPSFLTVDLKRTQAPSGKGWLHLQQLINQEMDSGCETKTWKQLPELRLHDVYQRIPQII